MTNGTFLGLDLGQWIAVAAVITLVLVVAMRSPNQETVDSTVHKISRENDEDSDHGDTEDNEENDEDDDDYRGSDDNDSGGLKFGVGYDVLSGGISVGPSIAPGVNIGGIKLG